MVNSVSNLKLATFNVQSGVETTRGYWHYIFSFWKYFIPHSQGAIIKIAKFINSECIDIITFSEIEGGSYRSKNLSQVNLISNLTNLKKYKFFSTYRFMKIINQGNAIITRFPILTTKSYKLFSKGEPRYLGEAKIKINNKNITIFVTHLSLNKNYRKRQIKEIAQIIKNAKGHLILSGDFNIHKESEIKYLIDEIGLKRINHPTYPSWNPKKGPDHIFLSKDFKVVKSQSKKKVILSDHLPLIVEVNIK